MKNHDHPAPAPACEHLHLAYCKDCKVVYCKDCGKEWKEPAPVSLPSIWIKREDQTMPNPYGPTLIAPNTYQPDPWPGSTVTCGGCHK